MTHFLHLCPWFQDVTKYNFTYAQMQYTVCACITDNELPSKLRVHSCPACSCLCMVSFNTCTISNTHYFIFNTHRVISTLPLVAYVNDASAFLVRGILQVCTVHFSIFVPGCTANTLCSNVLFVCLFPVLTSLAFITLVPVFL